MENNNYSLSLVGKISQVTKREREVLLLIAEGIKNSGIARKLFISTRTVETHKTHLLKKLNLKCTAELTCFAVTRKSELESELNI